MTILRRAAQLITDFRTMNLMLEKDKVYWRNRSQPDKVEIQMVFIRPYFSKATLEEIKLCIIEEFVEETVTFEIEFSKKDGDGPKGILQFVIEKKE